MICACFLANLHYCHTHEVAVFLRMSLTAHNVIVRAKCLKTSCRLLFWKQSCLELHTEQHVSLVKGAMTQLSYYSQFIIVTERMGENMVTHTKKTELSVHISTWNFNLKLLPCSPSFGQWSPFLLINCVILGSVGAPLCHALQNSPKSHQTSWTECSGTQWCRKANIIEFCSLVFHLCDKSSIYQRIDAGTISGWLWRCTCKNEMKHCNHDLFPTPAITSGICTTKKHGFRDWLLLLRRSHCWGCIVISSPVTVARLQCGWTAL